MLMAIISIKVCYSYSGGGALRDAISRRQYQKVAQASVATVTRHLAQLVEQQCLVKTGTGGRSARCWCCELEPLQLTDNNFGICLSVMESIYSTTFPVATSSMNKVISLLNYQQLIRCVA